MKKKAKVMKMKLKKSVKQVDRNPHIFCKNTCMYQDQCHKHWSNIIYPDDEYLLALMKDTPYCLYDERRDAE